MSKSKVITIRVREEDYNILHAMADKFGMSLSSLVNFMLRIGVEIGIGKAKGLADQAIEESLDEIIGGLE